MIAEKHKKGWIVFLDLYSRWLMKRHFRSIRYIGELRDRELPVLLISNHFCWYDGFIHYHLNNRTLKRRFHVMMLEEQLHHYKFLRNVGAFSVQKNSRSVIKSLNHSADILKHPNNMLLIFPQGEIQTLYTPHFHFEKGIEFILKKVGDVQIVFNVNLVDYFSGKKPELSVYYKECEKTVPRTARGLESAFNDFALECRQQQVER